jgi:hypothetical protein
MRREGVMANVTKNEGVLSKTELLKRHLKKTGRVLFYEMVEWASGSGKSQ